MLMKYSDNGGSVMKNIKRITAIVLSLILVFACAGVSSAGSKKSAAGDEFIPVLRFIAASDTHVRDDSDENYRRIGLMTDIAYRTAESNTNYNKLDALVIAGDLTNDGTKTEFDRFAATIKNSLKGDTKFLGVVAKNHDGYEMKRTELRDYYKTETGNDADFHTVINGYHFIGLSASPNDLKHYDKNQLKWLEEQLDAATAEDPLKPVFFIHHEHNRDTVYGSSLYDGWGVTFFNDILKKYPQVVDFSGHSHYPLNDPRSLWQGKFTAIGTGAIYYSEFTIDKVRTYHPDDSGQTATFWIVEVDASNRIRLRGIDTLADECLVEYILDNPANPDNREYTPEKRKAASKAPVFDEGTELTVTPKAGGCIAKVPVAKSTDGMPVVLYRIKATDKLGVTKAESWTLPKYYIATEQNEIELTVSGLPKGDYTISVVAENAYEMDSEPVTADLTVTEGGCPYCGEAHEGFGGAFILFFHEIAFFFAHLFGQM